MEGGCASPKATGAAEMNLNLRMVRLNSFTHLAYNDLVKNFITSHPDISSIIFLITITSVIVFENTLAKQRAYLINQPSESLNYQVITNDHLQINVDSKIADQLVTLDPFYPDWVARVDGQNVQIKKFQQNFRLIDLPPHAKTVDFYYQPQSLMLGFIISIISIIITLGLYSYPKIYFKNPTYCPI